MIVFSGASRQRSPLGSGWLENHDGSGNQVYFEDIVNPGFEADLESFAQAGRWSDNAEHCASRQKDDLSLSSFVEMNRYEGCFCPVSSLSRSVVLIVVCTGNHR